MVQKKIPMRQCLGCREMFPKRELIRVVRSPEGELSLYGDELVREACFDHKTRCVFIAGDAGANAAKKAAFYADKANVPCVTLPHGKLELGSAIGKAGCAMCAVADIGMAAAAVNKLAEQDPAYAEVAQQLSEKNVKIQSRRGVKSIRIRRKRPRKRRSRPKNRQRRSPSAPTVSRPARSARSARKATVRIARTTARSARSARTANTVRIVRTMSARSARTANDRPYRKNDGEKRPFRKEGDRPYRKNDGEKRPFRKDGDRPYRKNDGEKRPFRKDGDRPFRKSSTGKPSFNSGKRSFRNKT